MRQFSVADDDNRRASFRIQVIHAPSSSVQLPFCAARVPHSTLLTTHHEPDPALRPRLQHLHLRAVRRPPRARPSSSTRWTSSSSATLHVLRDYGLKLVWTVETHAHADHITSAGQLAEHAGAKTAAPAGLRHPHRGGATRRRRHAELWQPSKSGPAHARPHRRQHELCLARPCLHRRHAADQRLRPHRLPVGQRRGAVPQPDAGAVQAARRHHGLAGP